MNCVVFGVCIVLGWGSAQVSFLIEKYFEIVSEQRPHSNVELSRLVEQRPLNILLHDPERLSLLLFKDEVNHVSHIPEHFDAFTLIKCSGFHYPQVVGTVFERDTLMLWASCSDLPKPLHECVSFSIISLPRYDEGGRCCVEQAVPTCFSTLIFIIISSQWLD